MIAGIQVKICGLTSLVDAGLADAIGADYLGFNLHPGSPRRVTLEAYRAMKPRLPARKTVAVMVEPPLPALREAVRSDFDFYQLHLMPGLPVATVSEWAATVGPDRLWLAPKLPPGAEVPGPLLTLAGTFLLDAYQPGQFGGTGVTGDWAGFRRLREKHPDRQWILAGGLNAETIGAALAATGARWVDVASGVEASPGVKSPDKLHRFAECLRAAARAG